jgi:XTP/dITP diphosphohydrolase
MEIVIASRNLHKIREIREMFSSFTQIDFTSLINFPAYVLPEETGKTCKENAIFKAKHAAATLDKWVLADDSGLVVPSLVGNPGINSRQYACEDATDSENSKKLLTAMQEMKHLERTAYFECFMTLANAKVVVKTVSGVCEGFIASEARGRNGFGYDSVFIKNEYDKTFGEIDEAIKNRISHRRKAIEKLMPTIEKLTL